jgi:trk system potassium uptake protein TrkH
MQIFGRVLPFFGWILLGFSFIFLIPLAVGWALNEPVLQVFTIGYLVIACVGVSILAWTQNLRRGLPDLRPRDGMLLVTLCWSVLPAFSAIPLYLYFEQAGRPITFAFAYFEATSGITTTGSTVLTGLDNLPFAINLWRCGLQWVGGMGILVLAVAILPLVNAGAGKLFRAESTGPLKESKLTPRIQETAKGLWLVYSGLSLLCLVSFWLGGMSWGDAWLHMFSTMSLGGLSSYDASFAAFESPLLEWICVLFMMLASGSFALYFAAIIRGSMAVVLRDHEWRATMILLTGASLLVSLILLFRGVVSDPFDALRLGFFNLVSIASTTGFATTDFSQWPVFIPVFMLMLSGVATSAGSTGAGIKMARLLILLGQTQREIFRLLHPRAIHPLVIGGGAVRNDVVFSMLAFLLVYGATVLVMTFLLLLFDRSLDTAFSAVVASINNTGPGLGEIGPAGNYSIFSTPELYLLSLAMILGRLEILAFIAIFTREFWRQ